MTSQAAFPAPTVSVIMPIYNCVNYFVEALDSIVTQTQPPLEIIVIDDSTDGTSDIVRKYIDSGVVHMVPEQRMGIYQKHNLGIATARGELIAFLSGDDVWMPEKLSLQAALMVREPNLGYTTTNFTHFIDANSPPNPNHLRPGHYAEVHQGNMLETLMVRKTLFDQMGGFSQEYRISADVDWFARMIAQDVPTAIVPQILLRKRLHGHNSHLSDITLTQSELLRILRNAVHDRMS